MARKPGERFPSDNRGWFRVYYDPLLDDPRYEQVSADVFRFRFNLFAMMKRTRSEDGEILLSRRSLLRCAVREQYRHAAKILHEGCEAGLWEILSECADGGETLIRVPNWAKEQRIAPKDPRQSPDVSPDTETDTQTDSETQSEREIESRRLSREGKGSGGKKPTTISRCSCPANFPDSRLEAIQTALKLGDSNLVLTETAIRFAWLKFQPKAHGQFSIQGWCSEFAIWLADQWPLEGYDSSITGHDGTSKVA